jgi:hypothetical protein
MVIIFFNCYHSLAPNFKGLDLQIELKKPEFFFSFVKLILEVGGTSCFWTRFEKTYLTSTKFVPSLFYVFPPCEFKKKRYVIIVWYFFWIM